MTNRRAIARASRGRSASVVAAGFATTSTMVLAIFAGCLGRADAGVQPAARSNSPAAASSPSASAPSAAVPPPPHDARAGIVNTTAASPSPDAAPFMLDMDGIRREMHKARGHTLFVHLWASWCGPCLGELPLVDRFARSARARGATVLSVSLDNDWRGIARVPEVLRARAPTLTTYVARFDDPEQFMSLFSRGWEGAIPALFAFDRAGKLSSSLIGEVEPAALDALLARLADGPPGTVPTGPAASPSAPSARPPRPEQPAGSGAPR